MTAPDGVVCRSCGKSADDYTTVNNSARPFAGAIAVCFTCRAIAIFTGDGMQTRDPSADELAEILADSNVQRAIAMATIAHRGMVAGSN